MPHFLRGRNNLVFSLVCKRDIIFRLKFIPTIFLVFEAFLYDFPLTYDYKLLRVVPKEKEKIALPRMVEKI